MSDSEKKKNKKRNQDNNPFAGAAPFGPEQMAALGQLQQQQFQNMNNAGVFGGIRESSRNRGNYNNPNPFDSGYFNSADERAARISEGRKNLELSRNNVLGDYTHNGIHPAVAQRMLEMEQTGVPMEKYGRGLGSTSISDPGSQFFNGPGSALAVGGLPNLDLVMNPDGTSYMDPSIGNQRAQGRLNVLGSIQGDAPGSSPYTPQQQNLQRQQIDFLNNRNAPAPTSGYTADQRIYNDSVSTPAPKPLVSQENLAAPPTFAEPPNPFIGQPPAKGSEPALYDNEKLEGYRRAGVNPSNVFETNYAAGQEFTNQPAPSLNPLTFGQETGLSGVLPNALAWSHQAGAGLLDKFLGALLGPGAPQYSDDALRILNQERARQAGYNY